MSEQDAPESWEEREDSESDSEPEPGPPAPSPSSDPQSSRQTTPAPVPAVVAADTAVSPAPMSTMDWSSISSDEEEDDESFLFEGGAPLAPASAVGKPGSSGGGMQYSGAALADDDDDIVPGLREVEGPLEDERFLSQQEIVASPLMPVVVDVCALAKLAVTNALIDRVHGGLQTLHVVWNAEQALKLLLAHERRIVVLAIPQLIDAIAAPDLRLCTWLLVRHIERCMASVPALDFIRMPDTGAVRNFVATLPSGYLLADIERVVGREFAYTRFVRECSNVLQIMDVEVRSSSDRIFAARLRFLPRVRQQEQPRQSQEKKAAGEAIFAASFSTLPHVPGTGMRSVASAMVSRIVSEMAPKSPRLSAGFLLHHVLSLCSGLRIRARADVEDVPELANFLSPVIQLLTDALASGMESFIPEGGWSWDRVCDVLDGRLLCTTLMCKETPKLSAEWRSFFLDLWHSATSTPLPLEVDVASEEESSAAPFNSAPQETQLLPIRAPFFERILSDCPIPCQTKSPETESPSGRPFEDHHYHSMRPLNEVPKTELVVRVFTAELQGDFVRPNKMRCEVSVTSEPEPLTRSTKYTSAFPASWGDDALKFLLMKKAVSLTIRVFGTFSGEERLLGTHSYHPGDGKCVHEDSSNRCFLRVFTRISTSDTSWWASFLQRFSDSMKSRDTRTSNIHLARSDGHGLEIFRVPFKCCAEGCATCSAYGAEAVDVSIEAASSDEGSAKGGKKHKSKRAEIEATVKAEQEEKESLRLQERLDHARSSDGEWDKILVAFAIAIRSMDLRFNRNRARALEMLAEGCFSWWRSVRNRSMEEGGTAEAEPAALALQLIQDCVRLFSSLLSPETVNNFCTMLWMMSFDALAHQLACFYVHRCGISPRPAVSELLKLKKKAKRGAPVSASAIDFQLERMGPMLHRCFGSKKDPRMSAFDPDAWQRKVLDAIDAERSALVVAATSLGKTSICFYALQRMLQLRVDNKEKVKRILVYVAPTKALANQVSADFYDRCKGSSVTVGVFTRDYRVNDDRCDVLVTVPSAFEILLLQRDTEFTSKLFFAIVDEVHSIQSGGSSQEIEGGSSWESVLRMCPCPILALSATIGNPSSFHEWLSHIEHEKRGREFELITFNRRFADTSFFFAAPNKDPLPTKVLDRSLRNVRRIHPLAIMEDTPLPDVAHALVSCSLSPEECFVAQRAIFTHSSSAASVAAAGSSSTQQTIAFPLDRIDLEKDSPSEIIGRVQAFMRGMTGTEAGEAILSATFEKLHSSPLCSKVAVSADLGATFDKLSVEDSIEAQRALFGFLESIKLVPPKAESPFFPAWLDIDVFHTGPVFLAFLNAFVRTNPELFREACSVVQNHPCARPLEQVRAEIAAGKLALSLAESLVFVRVASHVVHSASQFNHPLKTSNFFAPWIFITRDLVYVYEKRLKSLLSEIALLEFASFKAICRRIAMENNLELPLSTYPSINEGDALTKALVELNTRGDLPAVVFLFSRLGCENEALKLGRHLLKHKKEISFAAPRSVAEKKKKRDKEADPKAKEDWRKLEMEREESCHAVSAVNPEYSFAGKLSKALEDWKGEWYMRKLTPRERELTKLFELGIGVHHAGLSRVYRNMVEVFFRAGHLRVVFATGTLALGINMPLRSVIFLHSSPMLNSLMFRQMSGRAGRRGFDNIGNVVFMNFSRQQIKDLLLSRLSSLQGQFPLTVSNVLRIAHTTEALPLDYSLRFLNPVSVCPLYAFVQGPKRREETMLQLQYLTRFSLEFLRRFNVLDEAGRCVGMSGIVQHLHYQQPANFVLVWGLQNGLFQEICSNFPHDPEKTAKTLLHFLAHVFNPHPLPRLLARAMQSRKSSKIIMQPLSQQERKALRRYNKETLGIFFGGVRALCAQSAADPSNHCLPLSGTSFLPQRPCSTNVLSPAAALQCVCRSPFVAISGHDDNTFKSAAELATTCLETARFEGHFVPCVENVDVGLHDNPALNSYALDFLGHGDIVEISEVNAIGGAWATLYDWLMLLRAAVASLKKMHYADSNVVQAFEHLSAIWSAKFSRYGGVKH